ncbi:transmembrane sensor [Bordetella ansorpii]|uniref:Transmembrane sensor n=2 Tax=Bordetella ansorpii TaxID=288768 RepID=A0A157QKB6_9BORD|nr:transmembrane sensor [Bordetella ansorpii]
MKPSAMSSDLSAATPDALRREALAWLRRLSLGRVTRDEVRAFEAWRATSPEHQAACEQARQLWEALGSTAGMLAGGKPGMVAAYERAQVRRVYTRRAFLGAAGATFAATGVAVAHPPLGLWRPAAEWGADYATAAGEQRTLALGAGVDVTFNTRTSASRAMQGGRLVGLDLLAGETAVDLQGGHPFAVTAGVGQSVADASRFEVRYLNGKVFVTCLDGTVQVRHPAATRPLQAGQQTVYDDRAIGGIAPVDAEAASAWRRGLLVFHRTRLSAVIDEINRYRPGRVLLANSSMRDKPVSGNFQIADPDKAIAQLQYMFDLQPRLSLGGVLILS